MTEFASPARHWCLKRVPFVRAGKCKCTAMLGAALGFIKACNIFNAELSESL